VQGVQQALPHGGVGPGPQQQLAQAQARQVGPGMARGAFEGRVDPQHRAARVCDHDQVLGGAHHGGQRRVIVHGNIARVVSF
jgi:hypothetical protein